METDVRFLNRLLAQIQFTDTCWLWTAYKTPRGYGQISLNGRLVRVHRILYEMCVGPVSEGLELDHLCRVPACCNPSHLEPVTHQVNLQRGIFPPRWKTHCKRGHPLTDDNIYRRKLGHECRICAHAGNRQRRYRSKLARSSRLT